MASIWTGISIPPAGALNGAGKSATERQLTVAAARRIVPLIYGEDRVGALLLNVLPHAFNTKMLVVQVLWAHAFDSISELKLNDQDLPAGSTVTHYRGDQLAQDPDMHFAMAAQGITYNVALTGFGYSVILIPTKSVGDQLNFTAKIRGRRVYDPRKDSTMPGGAGAHRLATPATWEWSDVPALALADWTASTVYGAGRPVDWSSVPAVANANAALVGGERRRVIGASITAATDVAVLAEALRAYAGCWAIPTAAGVKFIPDADAASVADLTHDAGDLTELGPLVIRDVSSAPTAVEVIFTDTTKVPWRDNSAIAELPGAGTTKPWRLSQVRMPGVQRYSQAMREAIERLNKFTLADLSTTARVPDQGIRYQRGDIVRLSHPRGLTLKPMRVLDSAMLTLGQWQLDLQEHDPAVYDNSVQTQPSVPDTSLNNPAGPPDAPVGLALSVVPGALRIRRTRSTELDWAACEMVAGASPGTGAPVPADVGRDGADWLWPPTGWITVWARDVDSSGARSAWVSASINVDSSLLLDAGNIEPPAEWLNSNVAIPRGTLNADPGLLDPGNAWEWSSGVNVREPSTAPGALGVRFFQAPVSGEKFVWSKGQIAVASSRRYNFSALLYAYSGNARPIFLVVRMFRANGSELLGGDTGWGGNFAGYVFSGLPAVGQFTRYGADFGAGTSLVIPLDVAYVRVGVWFQHPAGTGSAEQAAEDIRLEDVTDARQALEVAYQAIADAATAQSSADGKIESFYQPSAPAIFSDGDIWFDTDDGNKQYVAVSGAWVLARDTGIGQAITAAAGAQATANGKITTFYAGTAPSAGAVGDLWFNTADRRVYRWSGSSWVLQTAVGAGDIGTGELSSESATALRSATGGTVNLIAAPTGTSTLVSLTYTAPVDLTVRVRMSGFIRHFGGYGHPSGTAAAFAAYGKISTNSSDVPGAGDILLSSNTSSVDPATVNPVPPERQFSMTAGQTLTFYAIGYVGSITNQSGVGGVYVPGAICEVSPTTMFLEGVKR